MTDFVYPPKGYKTLSELSLEENEKIRTVDINSLTRIDQIVHSSTENSKIVEYFNGKTFFITGGTGFLGKLLIEKLLRTCKEIDTIYMLVRPKKGKNAESRIDETFEDLIFAELEKANPKFRHKIVAIKGDISLPDMGISKEDKQLLIQRVNVIFHVAATVRFDEKLHLATAINVNGTKDVMLLAQQCKQLSSLVHVSTAYSQCNRKKIDEVFYEPGINADDLSKLVEAHPEKYLEKNKKKIIKEWPNTYSFTKAVAESVVKSMGQGLPLSIIRPGIVTSTYKEPIKSWIDNMYGPMGAVVGVGTGVIRSFHLDKVKVTEIVPADYVVNAMIAAAYQNQFNSRDEIKIYNYVSSPENPLTWGDFEELCTHYGLQNPSRKSIWYSCNTDNKNYYVHLLYIIFFHFIPAIFVDCYLRVIGKKPRMVKMYEKIQKFSDTLARFSTDEWYYKNLNTQKLWKNLPDVDRKLFNFSLSQDEFLWNDYISLLGGGVRLYLLKDDLSTIPEALKKYNRLYWYHLIFKCVCYLILFRLAVWFLTTIFAI